MNDHKYLLLVYLTAFVICVLTIANFQFTINHVEVIMRKGDEVLMCIGCLKRGEEHEVIMDGFCARCMENSDEKLISIILEKYEVKNEKA